MKQAMLNQNIIKPESAVVVIVTFIYLSMYAMLFMPFVGTGDGDQPTVPRD